MTLRYHKLSDELQERILQDRKNHWECPYRYRDEAIVRRRPNHDKANLWRPAFVRDVEKIMHVPYYNRYSDKTQVFSLYKNDDISRRALHVQLVSRIARNIGSVLGLNLDLIESISLGHDIGHTPFGHAGERMLNELYYGETGRYFNHNVHSVRVLDTLCNQNISLQTLDGILCHNGELELKEYRPKQYSDFATFDHRVEDCYVRKEAIKELIPNTLEGCVMRISDIIAYLGKDRQDARRLHMFQEEPSYTGSEIGTTNAEIINNMIVNIIERSYGKPYLQMDEVYFQELQRAKKENYQIIYGNEKINSVFETQISPMFEEVYYALLTDAKANGRDSVLYCHHVNYINEITRYGTREIPYEETPVHDMIVDFMAGMTDDYFVDIHQLLCPTSKHHVSYIGYFEQTGE